MVPGKGHESARGMNAINSHQQGTATGSSKINESSRVIRLITGLVADRPGSTWWRRGGGEARRAIALEIGDERPPDQTRGTAAEGGGTTEDCPCSCSC